VLSLTCSYRPLVCESDSRATADSRSWRLQPSGTELIQYSKLSLQYVEKADLIFAIANSLLARMSPAPSQLRAPAHDIRVSISSGRLRHVGVNRHKVTTLPGVVGGRRSRAGQEKWSCVFQTHHAGNPHRSRKKTFIRHPRDTLGSHPSCIRCEWRSHKECIGSSVSRSRGQLTPGKVAAGLGTSNLKE
jgi:hypothetical protein